MDGKTDGLELAGLDGFSFILIQLCFYLINHLSAYRAFPLSVFCLKKNLLLKIRKKIFFFVLKCKQNKQVHNLIEDGREAP